MGFASPASRPENPSHRSRDPCSPARHLTAAEDSRRRKSQRSPSGSGAGLGGGRKRCSQRACSPSGPPPPAAAPHPVFGLRGTAEEKARKHRLSHGTHLPVSSQGCTAGLGQPPASSPSGALGGLRQRPSTSGSAATSAARAPFPGRGHREAAAAPSWLLRGPPGSFLENLPKAKGNPQQRLKEIPNRDRRASVPKFDKVPWLSKASFINKPLVLSLPKRSPHSSATFLISSKKDMNLPIVFQVPDVLSKVQPRIPVIPNDLKISRENFMSHRMMSLHQPKAQTVPKPSCDDILTESTHCRLPILGPRTAVFCELLADTYKTLQETQHSSLPRKERVGKATRQ
ncbi:PREDICTED: uncharacterized protein C1orf105 homolog [Galeopterus variegatus]|uniref:Uncharacterized protein C1orf105 homolog n=1 Tax=Galeopterus variegatus TaxID=482537 RepID=A0ABM0S466_GALVR|nr:PREDICTED: uncharacterized protein C1orf105 homolog [Galeopterus variegatus]